MSAAITRARPTAAPPRATAIATSTRKKLRVFCLSTSEIGMSWDNVSLTQRLWFARALKAVGAKAGWGIVILSHYPLDFTENLDKNSSAKTLGNILKQYVDGGSVTLSGMTVSFKDSNSAKIYAAFHGHTHNFCSCKAQRRSGQRQHGV